MHQKSSNLHRIFMFKCRNEFHIMPWRPGIGWSDKEENYFCGCLHRKNWLLWLRWAMWPLGFLLLYINWTSRTDSRRMWFIREIHLKLVLILLSTTKLQVTWSYQFKETIESLIHTYLLSNLMQSIFWF
jgi:hypothetical protein